jgi:hypothetical protein
VSYNQISARAKQSAKFEEEKTAMLYSTGTRILKI